MRLPRGRAEDLVHEDQCQAGRPELELDHQGIERIVRAGDPVPPRDEQVCDPRVLQGPAAECVQAGTTQEVARDAVVDVQVALPRGPARSSR